MSSSAIIRLPAYMLACYVNGGRRNVFLRGKLAPKPSSTKWLYFRLERIAEEAAGQGALVRTVQQESTVVRGEEWLVVGRRV